MKIDSGVKKQGLSPRKLKILISKWKRRFLLKGWSLSLKIVDFKRKDFRQSGDIKVNLKNKKAVILLTNKPFRNEEITIIHELLHLVLWKMDHFCEKTILKHSKPFKGDHDKYFTRLETTVARLTEILFKIKK